MNICERLNASRDCLLETFGGVGLTQIHGGLHGCQHVLGPVLSLASEDGDLRVASFALRNIARDLRRTDNDAFGIFHRRYRERNIEQAAVLALTDRFIMVDPIA